MPQLDAIRAFAVGGVAWAHWRPPSLDDGLPWAGGVQLFFVLSGFLITGILLGARERAAGVGVPRGGVLRSFYARRFLRIFPIYYAAIAVTALLDFGEARAMLAWNLTYTSNLYFFLEQAWTPAFGHFWSLAVEEQFYLVWPFIVLFVPTRRLIAVLVGLVGASVALALSTAIMVPELRMVGILPLGALDALGAGGLLAAIGHRTDAGRRYARACLWIGLPVMVGALALESAGHAAPWIVGVRSIAMVAAFVWVVERAATGVGGWQGRVLSWRPLLWIGSISYGLYVFHNFAPHLLDDLGAPRALRLGLGGVATKAVLTTGAAYVSYRFFEAPINRLKSRFPYVADRAVDA